VLCLFQTTTGLKGARKLQLNGISLASAQGIANTNSAVSTGIFGMPAAIEGGGINTNAAPGGTGSSSGTGNAIGTSNGFVYSGSGQALSSGTAGGNSTSSNDLTVLSMNPAFSVGTGGGLSGGILSSVGVGQGAAGGK
jgi:hypothetical protein